MLCWTHFGPDLHRRSCGGQVSHSHQIVGGTGEGEDPIYFADSAMPQLAQPCDRLQPAKAFFDPLPLSLADGITRMPRGAAINRAAAAPSQVLRHVRRYSQIPALGYKPEGVKPLVSTHTHRLRARKFLQHDQRRLPFRFTVASDDYVIDTRPVSLSHHQVPA